MSNLQELVPCKVLKNLRVYGKLYKKGEKVDINRNQLTHYGKSVEVIQTKIETKKGDK